MSPARLLAVLFLATLVACDDGPVTPDPQAPSLPSTSLGESTVGAPFSRSLAASGGTAPLSYSAQGLPAGVALDAQTGTLSGSPSSAGSFEIAASVSDAAGRSDQRSYPLLVLEAPSFLTASLPPATATASYAVRIEASGGKAPLAYGLSGGSAPPGLTLDASGTLSGTPSAPGSYSFEISVTDAHGSVKRASFTLEVRHAPPIIATSELTPAFAARAYRFTFAASGGTPPYSWSKIAGELPSGLALSTSGELSGTPALGGTFAFTLEVRDAQGQSAQKDFSLVVISTLAITTSALPDAYRGIPYQAALEASGGVTPYTYSLVGGSLPSGLQFDNAGRFSGTPAVSGSFGLTLTLQDASQQSLSRAFTLTVLDPPGFASSTLRDGVVGMAYSDTLQPSGGRAPFTYRVSAGALPAGLQLSGNALTGTPTAQGTATFTVEIRDANGQIGSQSFSLRVTNTLAITSGPPPDAYTDTPYAHTLAAMGGSLPYRWALASGALPPGISLSTSGQLSGTPSTSGGSTFTVSVTDATNLTATKTLSLTAYAPPVLAAVSARTAYVSDVINLALSVTGGKAPYTFSSAGSLPPGLSLGASSGLLQGTLTTAGSFSFDATAADANGRTSTRPVSFTVHTPPAITSTTLPEGDTGRAYSTQLTATGGQGTLTWSFTGTLPSGLSLSSTGLLSGTPTTAGSFSFTVRVTDAGSRTDSRTVTVFIQGPPAVTTSALADGYVGSSYSATLTSNGGRAPFTWSIVDSPPPGLALSSSGVLSGVPTSVGTFSFTARVTDSLGRSGSRTLSLVFYLPPSVGPSSLRDAYVSELYDLALFGVNGKPPYTFSLASGALPAGLSLAASGQLSGTPTAPGNASFEVTVSDANGRTGRQSYTLSVYSLPTLTTTTLPEAHQGQPYAQTLTASGGKPGYFFFLESGAPPTGITLNSGGQLSGTPTGGSSSFTVRVYDVNNRSDARTLTLSVSISDGGSSPDAGPLFTLGHWNIEWFGSDTQGPPRSTSPGGTLDDLQIANARNILGDAGVNLWGLVEMVDTADFQALKAQLPGYNGFLSDDPLVAFGSSYSPGEQKLGVLYDNRLTFQSATLILTDWDADFAGRPPMRVDFTTSIQGSSSPLTLIVLHMKAFADQPSYDRRQRASAALKSYLDSNLPSNRVFVVGDWNDDVDVSITFNGGTPLPSPYENFVAAASDYSFVTRPLSLAGENSTTGFPDMIDHTLASNEVMANYVPGSAHVLRPTWISDYDGTTSDHYPVLSRYAFTSPPPPPPSFRVFINEFLPNEPSGTLPDGGFGALVDYEFVELVNTGPQPADLSGWTLWDGNTDAGPRHVFSSGTVLQPGKAWVIFGGPTAFPPGTPNTEAASSGRLGLNNTGTDQVTVRDSASNLVNEYIYSSTVDNVSYNRATDADPDTGFVLHTNLSATGSSPGQRADGTPF